MLARPPLRVWVWTSATLVLVVVAVLLWHSSDAAATSSTTAPAPAVSGASPADQLQQRWSAGSAASPRRVVAGGLVLTTSATGLVLHDPASGRAAWHYTRANATLCDATAVNGLVIAVFRTSDRCDEAVALHADTGVRAWYRNVNFAADVQLTSTDQIVLASAPTGLATLDPTGDNTRWRYRAPADCRLVGADVGSTGVVVLQRCADGDPLEVKLFDGFAGSTTWTRTVDTGGAPARLAGVDRLVDLVVADQLQVLSPTDGATLQALTLPALPPGQSPTGEPLQQAGAAGVALVWARGTVYALDQDTGTVRWQLAASGLPAVGTATAPAGGTVLVPEVDAFVQRAVDTGAEQGRSTVTGLPTTGLPTGGRTFLVGPVVVYATVDTVLGCA